MNTVLHVGCGERDPGLLHPRFRGPGWHEIRLDIDPDVQPDIVANIVDLSVVESESVDAVWSSHNLEHVFAHEVPVVLRGFKRVLRRGGIALITVPNLQAAARMIVDGKLEDTWYVSPFNPIAPLDVVYGLRTGIQQGNEFMAHRTGFTAETLATKLRQVGFVDIEVEAEETQLVAEARKP
jgi:SAM-dependent methyltransferase